MTSRCGFLPVPKEGYLSTQGGETSPSYRLAISARARINFVCAILFSARDTAFACSWMTENESRLANHIPFAYPTSTLLVRRSLVLSLEFSACPSPNRRYTNCWPGWLRAHFQFCVPIGKDGQFSRQTDATGVSITALRPQVIVQMFVCSSSHEQ